MAIRWPVVLVVLLVAALGACSAVQDVVDAMQGRGEDNSEFGSPKGQPLSIPPNFNLRPPLGGTGKDDSQTAAQAARQRLVNASPEAAAAPAAAGGPSAGEKALLRHIGVASIDPGVRQAVVSENTSLERTERHMADKLLNWRASGPEDGETGDGAVKSEPVDEVPPVVIKRSRGVLGGVF